MSSYYEVSVRPNASGWSERLLAQISPKTKAMAEEIKRQLQQAVRDGLNGTTLNLPTNNPKLREQARRQGEQFADSFDRELKTKMRAALQNLPEGKARLLIDGSPAERELAKIRADLSRLSDANIGVDLSDTEALGKLEEFKLRLYRLTGPEHDIRLRVNSGAALAELAAIQIAVRQATEKASLLSRFSSGVASSASSTPWGGIGLAVAAVAALSTVGPLVAGATAGALGLAGAVGTVALAYKGIKRDMETGGGITRYLKGDISQIKGEIDNLSQVAGRIVAPFAHDLLSGVKRALPGFEPIVKFVSAQLGNAGADLGATLINVAQKSAPLFADVAHYIEIGAQKLRDWVASPSFDKFLAYARQELPIIIGYAKDFGKALIDTFVALAPAGEATLKILDLVFKGISGAKNLFKANGLGLLGTLLGSDDDKKKADETTGYIDALLASMRGIGDASDDLNSKVRIAATASTQAWLDASKSFDAGTATLTDTTNLFSAALTATRGDLLNYTSTMLGADSATQSVAKSIHDNLSSVTDAGTLLGVSYLDASGKFVEGSAKYTEGSSAIASALQAQVTAATQAAAQTYQHEAAIKGNAVAAKDALTVYKGYRQSLIDQIVQSGLASDKAKALADQYFAIPKDVDTFVDLLGKDNVALAITNLTDALNRLSTIITNPKVGLNTTDFDNSLRVKNSQLDYFGNQSANPLIDAITGPFNTKLGQSNNALDKFDGRVVGATVNLNDYASYKLKGISSLLLGLRDRTITVNTVTGGHTAPGSAAGNIFTAYASGGVSVPSFASGFERHVPQIAMPGRFPRIWAEPETHGEAYIPLANDWRRPRAELIMADVAKRMGGSYYPADSTPGNYARSVRSLAGTTSVPVGGSSSGYSGPVVVNVIDRDGSFVDRMRGEIARDQSDTALASSAGRAGRLT